MTIDIRPLIPLSTLIAVIAFAGCRDENQNLDETGAYCEETSTVIDLDEQTALGFAAQEVIDALAFVHETDLVYGDGGTAALTIDLRFDGGEARYVDSEAVYPDGVSEASAILCDSYVEIDVTVDFFTDDGVFDETWALPLEATAADAASFRLNDLTPDDFAGSYDFLAFDPAEYDEVTTSVWAAFDMGGPRGDISEIATAETQGDGDEGVAFAENQTVASWDGEDLF